MLYKNISIIITSTLDLLSVYVMLVDDSTHCMHARAYMCVSVCRGAKYKHTFNLFSFIVLF